MRNHPGDHRSKRARTLRQQVLRRDEEQCQLRLPGCAGKATQVHIAPILGGNHKLATLDTAVAACAHCHGRVDGPRARRRRVRGPSVTTLARRRSVACASVRNVP
jgi:5-methylcytosine-specific restriction endonuclease McrA